MKTKYIIAIVVFLMLSATAYWFFFIRITKAKAVKMLIEGGMHSNAEFLNGADEDYVIAWAKAFKKAESQFEVKGKKFNVLGGKAA